MSSSPCARVETPDDDMIDSPEDFRTWKSLTNVLSACQQAISPLFSKADHEANHRQRQHKSLMVVAAAAGSFAVIVAILQLTGLRSGFVPMPILEGISALIAIIAVAAGVSSKRQPGWFLARHQAERCRFLKFGFLITPTLWIGSHSDQEKQFRRIEQDVNEIRQLNRDGLTKWAEGGMMPQVPKRGPSCLAAPQELRELIDYYVRKRLCNQMNWFNKRAQQLSRRDRVIKHLPPWLFFGSVCAALIHFVYDELIHFAGMPAQVVVGGLAVEVSIALIFVAAILPVLGGGFRTLRSAAQFARNKSRYTAALEGLKPSFEVLRAEHKKLLEHEADHGQVSAYDIFYHLWRCEQILEAEHREWLRLMMQAEWFG